ncbi:hypothetical protein CWO91_21160 [Bradyrhizobium genosp. SA-3]|nr:hypothetical protein CWO91_21160 [Bradyrhizobium genosp. SA-3]
MGVADHDTSGRIHREAFQQVDDHAPLGCDYQAAIALDGGIKSELQKWQLFCHSAVKGLNMMFLVIASGKWQ